MKTLPSIMAAWLAAGGMASAVQVLTFDDLPTPNSPPYYDDPIPDGYGGLHWYGHISYGDPVDSRRPPGYDESNFENGVVSGIYAASTDGFGNPVELNRDGLFNLISGYFTAAFNDNVQFEVQGYHGNDLLYDNTYTLSATTPTLITLDYMGVDDVWLYSSGGTPHYDRDLKNVVIDNLAVEVVPEPGVAGLLLAAGMALAHWSGLRASPMRRKLTLGF